MKTYANGQNEELVKKIAKKARRSNVVKGHDKLVLLSTCDSYGSNDRTVLLASAKKSDENEVKTIEESVKANVAVDDSGAVSGAGMFKRLTDLWWVVLIVVVSLVLLGVAKWWFRRKKGDKKK